MYIVLFLYTYICVIYVCIVVKYIPYPYTQNKKMSKPSVLRMLELMQVNNCNCLNCFFSIHKENLRATWYKQITYGN